MNRIFQSLEVFLGDFPIVGRFSRAFSNHWKLVLGLYACFWGAVQWSPFPADELAVWPASAVVTDRVGTEIRVWLGAGDLDGRPHYVPATDDWIVQALVAAEDQRFWSHGGVDVRALARAMGQNLRAGRVVSGASTLSTQVIRLVEPRARTPWTKVVEAFRAWQLERRYTKVEILTQYLNRAPFGGNIVGIEAAARRYFGKGAADLSLAEAALLAGVPQSPSRGRPDRYPERARSRQAYVLERMQECGVITAEQMAEALAQPVAVRAPRYPFGAPHFADWVGAGGPAVARTTLDPRWQQLAEEALQRGVGGRPGRSGAVVVLEVATGAVRAMVGSPDYQGRPAGQVNGALAVRGAGSTLKPFVYAMAMDAGWLTPMTVLTDTPVRFRDYEPRNFDEGFRGRVTARDALVLSLNLPAIDVARRVGQDRFYGMVRQLGLTTVSEPSSHYGIGLVLGNAGVRLLDLANAYACLARGGEWRPVRVWEAAPTAAGRRLFSEEASWLVTEMLSGEERAMDVTGHMADTALPRMAWKTGTSAGQRDAWTIAYNPEYVVGVWVGQMDGAPADDLIGRVRATPIAWALYRGWYPDNRGPWYEQPAGVEERFVCARTGRRQVDGAGSGTVRDWAIRRVTRQPASAVGSARVERVTEGPANNGRPVRITAPSAESAYRWLPDWDAGAQQIALTASAAAGELYWFVNDRLIGRTHSGEPLFWPLTPGEHVIVCARATGESDQVRIRVE
jgi:penicillin-binding protein 1C